MKIAVILRIILACTLALWLGYLCSPRAIQALEASMSGAIGAIVGGVISALAFAFSIMSRITKESFAKSDVNKADVCAKYDAITLRLISDVKILICCLGAAIFLPVFRELDIPKISLPSLISDLISKSQLVTSLEIFFVFVSVSVLFEVCDCMFMALRADTTAE